MNQIPDHLDTMICILQKTFWPLNFNRLLLSYYVFCDFENDPYTISNIVKVILTWILCYIYYVFKPNFFLGKVDQIFFIKMHLTKIHFLAKCLICVYKMFWSLYALFYTVWALTTSYLPFSNK